MNWNPDIVGSCAVVTGGTGGIGAAAARALADAGCAVHILDRTADDDVVGEIVAAGGYAQFHQVDVTDEESVRTAFDAIAARGQAPDILVNCAGRIVYEPLLTTTSSQLRAMVDVNLLGAYYCLREAARHMAAAGEGRIINIASTASFVAPRLPASGYSMTKGGLRQLTIAAASELAEFGVLVNAVAPGTTRTEFVQGSLDSPEDEAVAASKIPLGRVAEPADIVGPIMFFASEAASYITGQVLLVDGGRLTRSS